MNTMILCLMVKMESPDFSTFLKDKLRSFSCFVLFSCQYPVHTLLGHQHSLNNVLSLFVPFANSQALIYKNQCYLGAALLVFKLRITKDYKLKPVSLKLNRVSQVIENKACNFFICFGAFFTS